MVGGSFKGNLTKVKIRSAKKSVNLGQIISKSIGNILKAPGL